MGKCLTATTGARDNLGSVLRGSTAWPQPGVRYGGQVNNQEGKLSSPQDVWARHGQAPGRAQTPGNFPPPPAPMGCSRGLSEPRVEPTKPQVNFWVYGALAVRLNIGCRDLNLCGHHPSWVHADHQFVTPGTPGLS